MIDTWQNESRTAWCVNTKRSLTRSLDLTEEGLALQATRTCTVAECDRPHYGKGLCQRHLERKRRAERQAGLAGNCSIEGCGLTVTARGWCEGHYRRWVEHGDPLAGRRSPSPAPCAVAACERPAKARAWCKLHYYRWKRTGDVGEVGPGVSVSKRPGRQSFFWQGDDLTYRGAHSRVLAARGPAKLLDCVDCGRRAHHWSYDHRDSNEQLEPAEHGGKPYSSDPQHYEPRCSRCHTLFDNRIRKTVRR